MRADENRVFQQVVALHDAPAYVRRARQVQAAFDDVLARCQKQRDEWLRMVRTRLGLLRGLAGGWEALRPLLADDAQVDALRDLECALEPRLRVTVTPTSSARALRLALRELCDSLERFNRRWREYVAGLDLTHVNRLRDGYNRYYLLEKECAIRSARLANLGFRRLELLTHAEVAALLPTLPVPRGKE